MYAKNVKKFDEGLCVLIIKSLSPMSPLAFSHHFIAEVLSTGDCAVDATVGNGWDTLFLAECVGTSGRVFGFDIQEQAIQRTQIKVSHLPQVQLFQCGHEEMHRFIPQLVKAVVFNFGYLPQGDKRIITQAHSSILALKSALEHLAEGGRIGMMLYVGHKGGAEEAQSIERFLEQCPPYFEIFQYKRLLKPNAPYFIGIQKKTHLNRGG